MNSLYKSIRGGLFLLAIVLPVLIYGCAGGPGGFEYKTGGVDAPVIERALAAEDISPGTTWRLYLWATDPDGDISTIAYTVEQPGFGYYSTGYLRVNGTADGKLQGYLYMNTVSLAHSHGWEMWYTVKVSVEDAAGNRSLPKVFKVHFNGKRQDDIREWEKAQLASLGLEEPPLIGRIHTELLPIGEDAGAAGDVDQVP